MTKAETPLAQQHRAAGARMVDFAGWDMPLQYTSIIEEHHAVRRGCGVFDTSHMGRFRCAGPGAEAFLERTLTRPIASMAPGQVRYALVCNASGGVEDDVLVSREGADAFHIVVNASNRAKLWSLWTGQEDAPDLVDLTEQQAMLAVQGPHAAALLAGIGLDPADLGYYRFADTAWQNNDTRLSRTGYTGENGFECFIAAEAAADLWHAVLEAGAIPCGLGARDTLRLEAGMPLYGHEIDLNHTPIEAGLAFAVGKTKTFTGSDVLQEQRKDGTTRALIGLRCTEGRPPREGYPIVDSDNKPIGVITSGAPSPTLEVGIAMGYVPSELAKPGTKLGVDIRGRSVTVAEVVELPFYRREK